MTWIASVALILAFGMHDLKFPRLFPIANWENLSSSTYVSKACNEASVRYRDNLYITHAIGMIPGNAFMNGEMWQRAVTHGMKIAAKEDPDDPQVLPHAKKHFDEEDTNPIDEVRIKRFYEGTESASNIASITGRHLSHGALHVLLKSIIVQAWTSFEILAGDLTNGARRIHPECFSDKAKSLKFYNVRSMVTLYKSFHTAFDDEASIVITVESPEIKSLALLRHLIAHKNGVVDNMFVTQLAEPPVATRFLKFKEDEPVLVTGEMVRSLVDPVTVLAYDLIRFVDEWLSANKYI